MDRPAFIFAGGGTGGHLFPGIAVAWALRAMEPDAEVTFLTTSRALDEQLLGPTPFARIGQPVQPFRSAPWAWPGFYLAWRRSTSAAAERMQRLRPGAVLGLGGYAAGPAVAVARQLGIRTAILNPDAIPGRANRWLARHADLVVLQWEVSRRYFGATAGRCQTLGCPIRAEFGATWDVERIAASRRQFGLDPARPVLLVTGASQGARSVNQTLIRAWPVFSRERSEWQLLHLTGAADEAEVRAAYAEQGADSARVLAFTHEMSDALAAAELVVSRAGASTLAELTALGKPSILFPYPYHKDQHQRYNAQVLVDAGAAILLDDQLDGALNAGPLLEALRACADMSRRAAMAAGARTLGRPDAAERVARWLLEAAPDGS